MIDEEALFRHRTQPALRDPHPVYRALRTRGPVTWSAAAGAYVVTGAREARAVLSRPDVFSSAATGGPLAVAGARRAAQAILTGDPAAARALADDVYLRPALLNADGADHARRRRLVSKAFTATRVRQLEPVIQTAVDRLVDELSSTGTADFVRTFAVPLPVTIIAYALGVDAGDLAAVKRWTDDLSVLVGRTEVGVEDLLRHAHAGAEFTAYLRGRLSSEVTSPTDTLVGALVAARDHDERLTGTEVLVMCQELLVAGTQTTSHLLALIVLALAQDESLAEAVRREPALAPAVVEETLRLGAPVQGFFRTARRDCDVGAARVPAGAAVFVAFSAANRDPSKYPDPDALSCRRPPGVGHLSFGHGVHFCLGAALARAEARVALTTLVRRLREIRLVAPVDRLTWRESFTFHGPETLPISYRAAR